jgi:hypothetical protein
MRTPKILPWIARRHGVSRKRAEELWRQSLALADFRCGPAAETSDYWAYAMRTLNKLMACEGAAVVEPEAFDGLAPTSAGARSALPIIASQQRIGGFAFDAAEAFINAANEYWRRALRAANARH